jgi:hypothetical protein
MSSAPLALTAPLAAVLLLIAVPATITAIRGRSGTLRRNGRLGIHSPAAMASDRAFQLANRVATPVVAGAAVVSAVVAALLLVLDLGTGATLLIGLLGLAGSIGLLLGAGAMGERAARTVPVPARRPAGGDACGGCGCGEGGCAAKLSGRPVAETG